MCSYFSCYIVYLFIYLSGNNLYYYYYYYNLRTAWSRYQSAVWRNDTIQPISADENWVNWSFVALFVKCERSLRLRWEWVPEKSSRRISGECEKLQREKKIVQTKQMSQQETCVNRTETPSCFMSRQTCESVFTWAVPVSRSWEDNRSYLS